MKAKRIWWKELEKELLVDHLVFLDESGVNLGMIRRYGRALAGKRLVDHSPLNKPKATTVLAAIRTDGVFAIRQRNTGSGPASGRHRHHG